MFKAPAPPPSHPSPSSVSHRSLKNKSHGAVLSGDAWSISSIHPSPMLSLSLSPHMFLLFISVLVLSFYLSLSPSLPPSVAAAVSISSWQKGTLWINDTELLKVQILNNEFHHQKHNNFSNHKIALPFPIDCARATRCREHSLHPCKVRTPYGGKMCKMQEPPASF